MHIIYKCKNLGTTPYQNCRHKKVLRGKIESMQQYSTTPNNQDVRRGLRKIVVCSQPYLAIPSCVYCFWHVHKQLCKSLSIFDSVTLLHLLDALPGETKVEWKHYVESEID